MEPRDDKKHDEHQETDPPPQGASATDNGGRAGGVQVIKTDDPIINPEPAYDPDSMNHPDRTSAIETSRILGPSEAFNPNFVIVPVESDRPRQGRSDAGDGGKKAKDNGEGKGGDKKEKGQDQGGKKQKDHDQGDKKDDQKQSGGRWNKPPSLIRTLLFAGAVALICGVLGAWGYSALFGSSRSDKDSKSDKGSKSGKGSKSDKDSDSDKGADSGKKEEEENKLLEAQSAWMDAVKELRQARSVEKEARHAEEESQAVLDFFKKNLLASGRVADTSLTAAFWAGGPGKNMTLRQAVDQAESRVAETFAERPRAEAAVREMLGLAYLNLGTAPEAVKEFERALLLREAMQGVGQADTAACRNQLAVAYRLADRPTEAAKLFERNPNTPDRAAALAVRGSTLLIQKHPAEAELKLRECLTIRQKIQPDDWTTFDTKSMLGEALLDQRRFDEAEIQLLAGYEGLKQREGRIPTEDKTRITKALERLVKLYDAWGKKDKEMKWREELDTAEATKNPAAPPTLP